MLLLFAENACYFRNALVRANYTNVPRGVHRTFVYLERFLANLLADGKYELKSRLLRIGAEEVPDSQASAEPSDVLQAVLALPDIYKDCVYLHYYEGYKTDEIARMTETPPSTIRNRLRDARTLLRTALEG